MRRLLSAIVLAAMLAMIPQAALAVSAQEALFGDQQPEATEAPAAQNDSQPASDSADDVYGSDDSANANQYVKL